MRIWSVVSASFVVAAPFHVYHAFVPDSSPPWRHALFAAINLGVAWGCWRRPSWFIWPFALLLLQQLYSHGTDFIQAWPERVDWSSVVVLLWLPLVAVALWRDRHQRFYSQPSAKRLRGAASSSRRSAGA